MADKIRLFLNVNGCVFPFTLDEFNLYIHPNGLVITIYEQVLNEPVGDTGLLWSEREAALLEYYPDTPFEYLSYAAIDDFFSPEYKWMITNCYRDAEGYFHAIMEKPICVD